MQIFKYQELASNVEKPVTSRRELEHLFIIVNG